MLGAMAEPRTPKRTTKPRCAWPGSDPLYVAYHDSEWGVPVHNDRVLFEFLVLEGAQAGLSWITVLRKREAYRAAFDDFDPEKVARYNTRKVAALLGNAGIVRNRAKIEWAIKNARAFLDVREAFGSFDAYQWRFVGGKPIQNRWRALKEVPARTAESDAFSKDLKQRGFGFVGSTIMYAHMQAVGMVNDHVVECFRHAEVRKLERRRSQEPMQRCARNVLAALAAIAAACLSPSDAWAIRPFITDDARVVGARIGQVES
jgi:DNA-3-methyladenine glycosylase I